LGPWERRERPLPRNKGRERFTSESSSRLFYGRGKRGEVFLDWKKREETSGPPRWKKRARRYDRGGGN